MSPADPLTLFVFDESSLLIALRGASSFSLEMRNPADWYRRFKSDAVPTGVMNHISSVLVCGGLVKRASTAAKRAT
jgi:hypothetical protein